MLNRMVNKEVLPEQDYECSDPMRLRVDLMLTDFSEERIASIFRVEKSESQEQA
jgi:hypothetical protein